MATISEKSPLPTFTNISLSGNECSNPASTEPSLRNVPTAPHAPIAESKEQFIPQPETQTPTDGSLNENGNANNPNDNQEFSLPPVDGGKDAWLFLAASFVVEALVWGFPFSFGVFQEYYSTHEPFAGSSNIAVIGTCAMGIMYLDLIVVFGLLVLFPRIQPLATLGGLLIMCLALALSSLSTNTTHLIITQGIIYALGGSFAYSPCILFMDQWFVRRKGLAYGIMWAGTGLAGVILPLVMDWLLHAYGFRTTLRVWAICLFLLTAPLLYFVKPRIPISQAHIPRKISFSFLKTPTFTILQACNTIEALGFFLPSIYLPTYARQLGASSSLSALTVILFNVSSVIGCILMGSIVDKWHVTTCILISTIGTAFSVFVIWGFATSLATLYVFSLVYGLFAGSFTSTWPGIMKDVKKVKESADPSIVFACLAAGRGIGNIASGPLSEALVKGFPWKGEAGFAYGSGFGTLIVFTGVTAVFGGASWIWRKAGVL
ncbi:putative MFS monocarboxylate transporter [Delitschia confertaspora ATCC 74209]|uniref:MFS monocarboxylate transporter n=1 Tax=Delitschia confertaspora ATCC 74209 TaxID=1513339 RepID=A0A9P4MW98_9PLEO|nr:putative MFS monocarboxylate transporter [Delitschia confertaspora ATCC 74209]